MKEIITVIKEQFDHIGMIFRMSRYEDKADYQSHYLGLAWQILNPAIQVGIYYLVFGVGLRQGQEVGDVPFIVWMLIGITAWFYVNSSILGASNSIYKQISLVSKMKFPVSVLPTTNIVGNLSSYFPMVAIVIGTVLFFGISPSIYWIQYIYYFICMISFLFSFGLLNATITILVRDYHIFLQSIIRLLFYISGAIVNIENSGLPDFAVKILRLNPIYYIIDGFRDTFLSREWFFEKATYSLIFWGIILILLILGSHLHMKFRSKFVDYI
ncbi:Teichoic acid translocation permease TagG [Tetragenococcus osmophilus]|uniref:Transport permease protein n=1 Tax=Tetragenococcus osmophilus TaxID=526944 RepID=A0AA38CXB6_9ENTE|nr:ABC transporter permease [Tetragenococcus osmophilus]AYW48766.1 Teichoic acid translocation permease TagG [Tetragenococcus osmophilus]GMA54748.1 transport permease protein [Alicyclobacillus contaminans]GMA71439.1 transport permease protein [Tetragenococcus osmophilus]